jgi:hypothetical protein
MSKRKWREYFFLVITQMRYNLDSRLVKTISAEIDTLCCCYLVGVNAMKGETTLCDEKMSNCATPTKEGARHS